MASVVMWKGWWRESLFSLAIALLVAMALAVITFLGGYVTHGSIPWQSHHWLVRAVPVIFIIYLIIHFLMINLLINKKPIRLFLQVLDRGGEVCDNRERHCLRIGPTGFHCGDISR